MVIFHGFLYVYQKVIPSDPKIHALAGDKPHLWDHIKGLIYCFFLPLRMDHIIKCHQHEQTMPDPFWEDSSYEANKFLWWWKGVIIFLCHIWCLSLLFCSNAGIWMKTSQNWMEASFAQQALAEDPLFSHIGHGIFHRSTSSAESLTVQLGKPNKSPTT